MDSSQQAPTGSPSLVDAASPEPREVRPIGDSPAGRSLQDFLALIESAELADAPEAEAVERIAAASGDMRDRAEEVVIEIARAEAAAPPDDYPLRFALVQAAAELRHPAALPFLRTLVATPIPPERVPDPHSFSTVAEETILRTTAVEGVAALAAGGDEAARAALFEILDQPSLSIRRAAVQALLATGDDPALRDQIARRLPEEQRFLLDLKRVDVRDVEQIADPQAHLTERGRGERTKTPPRLPGERRTGAPKAI